MTEKLYVAVDVYGGVLNGVEVFRTIGGAKRQIVQWMADPRMDEGKAFPKDIVDKIADEEGNLDKELIERFTNEEMEDYRIEIRTIQ